MKDNVSTATPSADIATKAAEIAKNRMATIKYALDLRDYTQARVARECGVEPTTVGAVIHGRSRSKKVENRIAAITHLPLAELWPEWHGEYANRRRRTPVSPNPQVVSALRALAG